MAQTFYTPRVVQTGKVPSTQTNFPALVLLNDARFKTVANGGHVANANGYDIRFYSDSGLTTALTFERVTYSASAGTGEFHVLVASMADALTIYIGYGDAALSSDASSTSVWDSDYKGVWHLGDGSSLSLTDSTSGAQTLSNNNTATATAGSKTSGAVNLVAASTQYLSKVAHVLGANNLTISAWVYSTDFSQNMMVIEKFPVNGMWEIFFSGGSLLFRGGNFTNTLSVSAPSNSNWHHIAGTINGTSGALYLDGSATAGTIDAFTDANNDFYVGIFDGATYPFNGKIDEPRVSKIARSANWITTEYNNQNDNAAFWPDGTEAAVGGSSGGGPLTKNGELAHGALLRGGRLSA